jgi:hypothetical protein
VERWKMIKLLIGPLIAYLTRLRFPTLFGVTAVLFVLDLFIPDAIPFADETLLALGAALLGSWKNGKNKDSPNEASGH